MEDVKRGFEEILSGLDGHGDLRGAVTSLVQAGVLARGAVQPRGSLFHAAKAPFDALARQVAERVNSVEHATALRAAGQWGGRDTAAKISSLLPTWRDPEIRDAGLRALAQIGGIQATSTLAASAVEADPASLRHVALEGLLELAAGGAGEGPPAGSPVGQWAWELICREPPLQERLRGQAMFEALRLVLELPGRFEETDWSTMAADVAAGALAAADGYLWQEIRKWSRERAAEFAMDCFVEAGRAEDPWILQRTREALRPTLDSEPAVPADLQRTAASPPDRVLALLEQRCLVPEVLAPRIDPPNAVRP